MSIIWRVLRLPFIFGVLGYYLAMILLGEALLYEEAMSFCGLRYSGSVLLYSGTIWRMFWLNFYSFEAVRCCLGEAPHFF